MTKTKIINNVPPADVAQVEAGLQADGYVTRRQQQSDGNFTVIGVKQVSDAAEAVSSTVARTRSAPRAQPMTKTKVVTDVEAGDVDRVEAGLRADGYATTRHLQPDGKFTVVGVKTVASANEAIDSGAEASTRSRGRGRGRGGR